MREFSTSARQQHVYDGESASSNRRSEFNGDDRLCYRAAAGEAAMHQGGYDAEDELNATTNSSGCDVDDADATLDTSSEDLGLSLMAQPRKLTFDSMEMSGDEEMPGKSCVGVAEPSVRTPSATLSGPRLRPGAILK